MIRHAPEYTRRDTALRMQPGMAPEQIAALLKSTFRDAVPDAAMDSHHPAIVVAATQWREIARFLRDDPRLRLNLLRCISGVDRPADDVIEVIYDLLAMRPGGPDGYYVGGNEIAIKLRVPRDGGTVPSVADIWPAADWHEREVYDMFGVVFEGHPDLRRILCPDDWEGFPLRKDYAFPLEYHGIPATTEFGQKNPQH